MKQIFLLNTNELDNLRHGIPLEIALPNGTLIQLQAENPRRKYITNNNLTPAGSLSERIQTYLTENPKTRSIDIAHGLGDATRSAVASCLNANRTGKFISSGHSRKRLWRLK